ncbi:hypothetical protein V8D89_002827 [Ganoderma adspersum]
MGEGAPSTLEPEVLDAVGEPVDAEPAAGGIGESRQLQLVEYDSHDSELKRMKVYELIGSLWVDRGTGFCSGDFKDNEVRLIARHEEDFHRVILTTAIRATVVYHCGSTCACAAHVERLIVWTEPNGVDYALSFEDRAGCAEVWHFIEEVQRIMNADGESDMNVGGSPPLPDLGLEEDMAVTESSPLIGPAGPGA